jgi:hypothetical protein
MYGQFLEFLHFAAILYFSAIRYVYGQWVYFVAIWYIFSHFGMLNPEKSGNLDYDWKIFAVM